MVEIDINWEVVQELGDAGLLTGRETEALIELAKEAVRKIEIGWLYDKGTCPYCFASRHSDENCPLYILESIDDDR